MSVKLRPAAVPGDMAAVRALFLEYHEWLNLDL